MIAVTGESRGEAGYKRLISDPIVQSMGKEDYLVILGGCGITEPRIDLRKTILDYRELPCSVLFLDGAYDDYDLLSEYPTFPWNGGRIQVFSRGIYRLMRGQVFTLEGKKILTIGGSGPAAEPESEKYWSWWPERKISVKDIEEAEHNVSAAGGHMDFVLTSTHPLSWSECGDRLLNRFLSSLSYGRWYYSTPVRRIDLGHDIELVHSVIRIC